MLHEDKNFDKLKIDQEKLNYLDREVSNYLEDLGDSPDRHELLTYSDEFDKNKINLGVNKIEYHHARQDNYYTLNNSGFNRGNELEILLANMKEEKE